MAPGKEPHDGISKFGARRFGIVFRAQLLEHSFAPEIVNQSLLSGVEMPAKHREIPPYRGMREKLLNEHVPIRLGFREEQNAGRETIDAMDDEGAFSPGRKSG